MLRLLFRNKNINNVSSVNLVIQKYTLSPNIVDTVHISAHYWPHHHCDQHQTLHIPDFIRQDLLSCRRLLYPSPPVSFNFLFCMGDVRLWNCEADEMVLPSVPWYPAMPLPCHVDATTMPCRCHYHAIPMPHHAMPMPYHAIPMPYHAIPMPYHAIPCHTNAIPCHTSAIPCHTMPYQCHTNAIPMSCLCHADVTSRCVTASHDKSRHVMSRHLTTRHGTWRTLLKIKQKL